MSISCAYSGTLLVHVVLLVLVYRLSHYQNTLVDSSQLLPSDENELFGGSFTLRVHKYLIHLFDAIAVATFILTLLIGRVAVPTSTSASFIFHFWSLQGSPCCFEPPTMMPSNLQHQTVEKKNKYTILTRVQPKKSKK
jgi:hypothetical protein